MAGYEISQLEFRKFEQLMESVEARIRAIADRIGAATQNVTTAVQTAGASARREIEGVEESTTRLITGFESLTDAQGGVGVGVANMFRSIQGQFQDFDSRIARSPFWGMFLGDGAGGGGMFTRKAGAFAGISQTIETALQGVFNFNVMKWAPTGGMLGGLVGLALYGRVQDESWRAQGEQIIQQLKSIGPTTAEQASAVSGLARRLSVEGKASVQDVTAVVGALRDAWVDAGKAVEGGYVERTLKIDKAFAQAAGTAAKFAGEIAKATGDSFGSAVRDVEKIGAAARASGTDFTVMSQMITQATSALRMQKVDAGEVASVYLNLRSNMQNLYKGADSSWLTQTSTSMVQLGAQTVAGLPQGMMGFLSRQMGNRGSAPEAIMDFWRGSMGGKGTQWLDAIREMGSISEARGGGSLDRSKFFAAQAFGGGDLAKGEAIVELARASLKGGDEMKEALKKYEKAFKDPFEQEMLKLSAIERAMNAISASVENFGAGLLQASLASVGLLASIAMYFLGNDDKAALKAFTNFMNSGWEGMNRMGQGARQAGGAFGLLGNTMFSSDSSYMRGWKLLTEGDDDNLESRLKAYYDRQVAEGVMSETMAKSAMKGRLEKGQEPPDDSIKRGSNKSTFKMRGAGSGSGTVKIHGQEVTAVDMEDDDDELIIVRRKRGPRSNAPEMSGG